MISGLVRVKLNETGPTKIITDMVDLVNLFSGINVNSLRFL